MSESWGRDPRYGNQPPWLWPVVIEPARLDRRLIEQGAEPAKPTVPLRIGDAERDEAVAALGDHFAAGRLTREELDERIDQAVAAKFSTDLEPLLADLPSAAPTRSTAVDQRPAVVPGQRAVSPLMLMLPIMFVGLAFTAVAIGAPWLLWGLVWVAILGRFWGRSWPNPAHQTQRIDPWHAHRPGGHGPHR